MSHAKVMVRGNGTSCLRRIDHLEKNAERAIGGVGILSAVLVWFVGGVISAATGRKGQR